MLKKIAGVLLLVIGLFFAVSSLKMIFVDTPKMKSALKDAVYVGQGTINNMPMTAKSSSYVGRLS